MEANTATTTNKTKQICCIKGCISRLSVYDEIRFFGLPTEDKMMLEKWLTILKSVESTVICSLHFLPNEMSANGLCADAVPTLNLDIAKVDFLGKIVRQWILENQYQQNISRRTCCDIAREARELLNITRTIPYPDWIRNFKYQPMKIKADPKGSKQYAKSGVAEIIKKLTDAERQEHINRLVSVDGGLPIKKMPVMDYDTERQDHKRRRIDNSDGILKKPNSMPASICEESIQKSECVKAEVLDVLGRPKAELLDPNGTKSKPIQRHTNRKAAKKVVKKSNVGSGTLGLCSGPKEDDTVDKNIASNEDALEYLKPLQIFASKSAEHSSIIGLLAQLQAIFDNRIEA